MIETHTPGPWRLNAGNEIEVMDASRTVARAQCGGMSGIKLIEAEANARLISAAPDLLHALKMCVIERSEWLDEARAAIAKAGAA